MAVLSGIRVSAPGIGFYVQAPVEPAWPGHWVRPLEGLRAEGCGSKPACAGLDSPKSQGPWHRASYTQ